MSRLIQILVAVVLISAAPSVAAQHYYQPDAPGHGLTVQRVGSEYAAQWYVHDGEQQRWFVSDVCAFGEQCPVYAVEANGFPAVGAESVDAGHIVLTEHEQGAALAYDLFIEGVNCSRLPGPLPPECIDEDGEVDRSIVIPGFEASGEIELERLID